MIHIGICDDETFMQEQLAEQINSFFQSKNTEITILKFSKGTSLLNYDK